MLLLWVSPGLSNQAPASISLSGSPDPWAASTLEGTSLSWAPAPPFKRLHFVKGSQGPEQVGQKAVCQQGWPRRCPESTLPAMRLHDFAGRLLTAASACGAQTAAAPLFINYVCIWEAYVFLIRSDP